MLSAENVFGRAIAEASGVSRAAGVATAGVDASATTTGIVSADAAATAQAARSAVSIRLATSAQAGGCRINEVGTAGTTLLLLRIKLSFGTASRNENRSGRDHSGAP